MSRRQGAIWRQLYSYDGGALYNLALTYEFKAGTPMPRGSTSVRSPSRRRRSAPAIPTWRKPSAVWADVYELHGKYIDAEALHKRALAIREKVRLAQATWMWLYT